MRSPAVRLGRLCATAGAVLALAACGAGASSTTTAGSTAGSSSGAASSSTSAASPSSTPGSEMPVSTPTSQPAATGPSSGPMLWPFTDAAGVAAWKAATSPGAADAWHLDAGQTGLHFVRDFLGYAELDRVTSTAGSTTDAVVGVGSIVEGTKAATAGLLRLTRASDQDPWEVLGTQDADLTVTVPTSGQTVTSPLTVSGTITGVDEAIAVALRSPASATVLGQISGIGAGGTQQPWTASVPFTAPSGTTVTIAVSTGGHLQAVERFAVTGAVVR